MWILPKQLHTLASALDTEALISDLNEQSQICAQSLFLRSKPSPARTWSAKWRRDSWTQHLSGRILKPSLGESFVESWTSSLGATHANHSAQQESVSELKIPDISGLTYQPELLQCDQVSVSLKTSRDISRWGCPTSSKTWEGWVTERRGAYSLRVKSGHLTRESGSSSWPTANARDWKDGDAACNQRAIDGGHQITLARAATCWPTPCAMEAEKAGKFDKGQMGQSLSAMANRGELGLHVPDNRSSVGSHQESWLTPKSRDYRGVENHILKNGQNIRKTGQVFSVGLPTQAMMEQQKAWATPNAFDWNQPETREQWKKRAETQREKGVNLHLPLKSQVTPETLSAKLNPRWVETLMGLPVGWVMPSCTSPVTIELTSCDYWATETAPLPQASHGELF